MKIYGLRNAGGTDITSDVGSKVLPPIYHINAVVEDVDATTRFLTSMLGVGPWQVTEPTLSREQMIVSEPGKIRMAGAWLGPTILELIQPLEGRTIWANFLKIHGEGLHHIAFSVPNWDELASNLQANGGTMVAGGVQDGMHWGYFETKPGGIIFELEEKMEGKQQFRVE